jgi:hypothetical protein
MAGDDEWGCSVWIPSVAGFAPCHSVPAPETHHFSPYSAGRKKFFSAAGCRALRWITLDLPEPRMRAASNHNAGKIAKSPGPA